MSDDVLAAVKYDRALTTQEIAKNAYGDGAWEQRTNVRNRLYELETAGLVICDDERPMRWLRPDPTIYLTDQIVRDPSLPFRVWVT